MPPPPERFGPLSVRTGALSLLLVLAVCEIAAVFTYVTPGYFLKDEATYHLMVKSIVERGSLFIWNDYASSHSPELVPMQTTAVGDHLSAQYPPFFPLLAAAPYVALGLRGLFLVNALAFVASAALTYLTARRALASEAAALASAILFAGATHTGEYALAAWPHGVSLAFCLGAFVATGVALDRVDASSAVGRSGFWPMVLAGALAGIAVGVRLDSTFFVGALAVPLVVAPRPRIRELSGLGLGLAPSLLTLSLTNRHRFGTLSPLSYGPKLATNHDAGVHSHLTFALLFGASVFLLWIWTRPSPSPRRRRALVTVAVALGVALAAGRALGHLGCHASLAMTGLALDIRAFPVEPSPATDVGWAAIGLHEVPKKALLQSSPFFVAAAFALVAAARPSRVDGKVLLLFLVPAVYLGAYGVNPWHGGGGTNLRYLVPATPFLCIASIQGVRVLLAHGGARVSAVDVGFGLACGALLFGAGRRVLGAEEPGLMTVMHLDVPLLLAAGIALTYLVAWRFPQMSWLAVVALATGVGWAAGNTYALDLPLSTNHRRQNTRAAQATAKLLSDDALVISDTHNTAIEGLHLFRRGLVIARGGVDGFATSRALALRHLGLGHRVFSALDASDHVQILRDNLTGGLQLTYVGTVEQPFSDGDRFLEVYEWARPRDTATP